MCTRVEAAGKTREWMGSAATHQLLKWITPIFPAHKFPAIKNVRSRHFYFSSRSKLNDAYQRNCVLDLFFFLRTILKLAGNLLLFYPFFCKIDKRMHLDHRKSVNTIFSHTTLSLTNICPAYFSKVEKLNFHIWYEITTSYLLKNYFFKFWNSKYLVLTLSYPFSISQLFRMESNNKKWVHISSCHKYLQPKVFVGKNVLFIN